MTWTLSTRIRSRFSLAREGIARIQSIAAELKTCTASEPAHGSPGRGSSAPALAHTGPSGGELAILIVEDEKYLANSLSLILAEHRVTVAGNGREAVALCTERDYDVILCDLWMRELTGMDVHREVLQRRPGQERRMVFMTGGAFTQRAQQFLDSVPNPILQKPFSTEELLQAVTGGRKACERAPAS
jgi:CheY-like chemotaxis protein